MDIKQLLAWLLFLAMTCWGTMLIVYSNFPAAPRRAAAWVFVILAFGSVLLPSTGNWKMICFIALFILVLACGFFHDHIRIHHD